MQTVQNRSHFPIWIQVPIFRLLLPLLLGITVAWYLRLQLLPILIGLSISVGICAIYIFVKLRILSGIGIQLFFGCVGAITVYVNDASNQLSFIGNLYRDNTIIVATLQEPLMEKNKSYKAIATVQLFDSGMLHNTEGNIIVYLQKDSSCLAPQLTYGSRIIFRKPLQAIQNAGNPGGFDYRQYCAFHGLYYQVFLQQSDYTVMNGHVRNAFRQMLFDVQAWVLQLFRSSIPGKLEAGLAEALLIGYRNDLDANLVQQYSNTGVVHIIAISGMHLGLIYGLLMLFFRPIGKSRNVVYIRGITIITVLWVFSCITGAGPSIVRSTVMFTLLVLGEMGKRTIFGYNNLALSALFILLYDPFALWDVGFQLSYAAVLSIMIFAKPISKLFYFSNEWIQKFWQLQAVTIAAQILTYPIVVYHFHQFPNLFLLTNLIAIPLSSCILYVLIVLLIFCWLPVVNMMIGKIASWLIKVMNVFVEKIHALPYVVTDHILYTIPQVMVLFLLIGLLSWWWLYKSSSSFVAGLFTLVLFVGLGTMQFLQHVSQRKLIVYNIPRHQAMDIIEGKHHVFIGDTLLLEDGFLQNFHLKPARIYYQVQKQTGLRNIHLKDNIILLGNKKMIIIDAPVSSLRKEILDVDLLIISNNPKLYLKDLLLSIHPKTIIADGTNSHWKVQRWQKEAEALHLQFYSVSDKGAYIFDW